MSRSGKLPVLPIKLSNTWACTYQTFTNITRPQTNICKHLLPACACTLSLSHTRTHNDGMSLLFSTIQLQIFTCEKWVLRLPQPFHLPSSQSCQSPCEMNESKEAHSQVTLLSERRRTAQPTTKTTILPNEEDGFVSGGHL